RKRRSPTSIPPSKRIAIRATVPIRTTSRVERKSPMGWTTLDAKAPSTRTMPGAGTGSRSVSFVEARARANPPATASTSPPNAVISSTGAVYRRREGGAGPPSVEHARVPLVGRRAIVRVLPHDGLPSPRVEAAPARPEDEREQETDASDCEQDVTDRVHVDHAVAAVVDGPGEDRSDGDQKDAYANPHFPS